MLPSQFSELNNYPIIKYVFEKQLDMQFVDLRCMLKSPLPGCSAGYNLTIMTIILNLFAGFSRRLYRPINKVNDNKRFVDMLVEFFPWDEEIQEAGRIERAKMLYESVRNPLTHELGIKGGERVHIIKNGRSSDSEILELEENPNKPRFLGKLISRNKIGGSSPEWFISVTGLYWAAHRLLQKLLATEHAIRAEERFKQLVRFYKVE